MKLHRGMMIKHKLYQDVAFSVNYAEIFLEDYEVNGYWMNLGNDKSWIIDQANIKIPIRELDDSWFYCVEPESKCLRKEKWIKL